MKKTIWVYSPDPTSGRALQALKDWAGEDAVVSYEGGLGKCQVVVARIEREQPDAVVVVAPLAGCQVLCALKPATTLLWMGAEQVEPDQAEWFTPDRRGFRFTEYSILRDVVLNTEEPQPRKIIGQKLVIGWVMRHCLDDVQRNALRNLYGRDVQIDFQRLPEGRASGKDLARIARSRNWTDLVLVAPLPVYADCAREGFPALKGVMNQGRFVKFQRVIGLEVFLEPLSLR